MQQIGIGVTHTSNRPEHLKLFLSQIYKHTVLVNLGGLQDINGFASNIECVGKRGDQIYIHIAKDIPNIAKAKNECLYALKDCDHIFLFDDDCFPIQDGWVDYFIKSNYDHLLYLTDRHTKTSVRVGADTYRDCGGCFMYITKEAFNKVGYFNTEYKQYGFEHAGWSKRFNNQYWSSPDTNKYIYSLDYQGEGNWGVKHKPSITDYKAMQESIDYNRQVFEKEINSDKIYYEYKS